MHKFLILLVGMIVAGAADVSAADVTTYTFPSKNPSFSISFPTNWVQKSKDDTGYLEMGTPDDAIWIDVWLLDKSKDPADTNTISDITDDMKSWLTDLDVKRAPDGDTTIGGIQFTSYQGTGKTKDGGETQVIEADICSPDGKNQIVICYYGNKGASVPYKADLQTIFSSIKAL